MKEPRLPPAPPPLPPGGFNSYRENRVNFDAETAFRVHSLGLNIQHSFIYVKQDTSKYFHPNNILIHLLFHAYQLDFNLEGGVVIQPRKL